MAVDTLRARSQLVDDLSRTIESGGHGLELVPDLLRRVLTEKTWQEFVTVRGTHVSHERFLDFVHAKPLAGLGADPEVVRRLIADDDNLLSAWDAATENKHGGDHTSDKTKSNVNNINVARPQGTSKQQALRRLRRQRPDLHAKVIADEISAHAAMVEAGFRPRTATVPLDSPLAIARTLRRRLDDDTIGELVALLSDHQEEVAT